MKKKLLLMACLFLGLGITGCGKTNHYEDFKTALSKNYDSFEAKISANASVESEGLSIDVNVPVILKMETTNDNSKMYIKLEKSTLIEEEMEMYMNLTNKIVNIYYSYLDNDEKTWVKMEQNLEEALKNVDLTKYEEESKKYIDKYFTEDRVVYVGEEDNLKHYQFVINDSLLKEIAEELEEEFETTGIELKVDIYLNKDNELAKIKVDLIDVLSKVLELAGDEIDTDSFDPSMFKSLNFMIEFSNHNNVKVEIPEEIINNAKSLEDIEDDYDLDYDLDYEL